METTNTVFMAIQTDSQRGVLLEHAPARVAPPPMYQVVLLNDDYTPMDFVVIVLQKVFGKDADEAARIMLRVHHEGRGVCGVYTRDVAATRVERVRQLAQMRQHPLQCIMEPAPSP